MFDEEFYFKVLVYPDEDLWVAHCLELDLVTVTKSSKAEEVDSEIGSVIAAQLRACMEHDNMEFLYRPAPQKIWQTYFKSNLTRTNSYHGYKINFGVVKINPVIGMRIHTSHEEMYDEE